MSDLIISDHLKSSYKMITEAFPKSVSENEYFPLLAFLYEHFSDRNLAALMAVVTGKDSENVLNDISKSVTIMKPSEDTVNLIHFKLKQAGFEKWLEED